ncbi:MAG TPA: PAS domain-containing protein [Actinomycetota bacterium]|nr:PAS domain-containing protein [Actinomycetota bacterium]
MIEPELGHDPSVDDRRVAGDIRDADGSGTVDYRALVEQIPAITYTEIHDRASPPGRHMTYVSPQAARILGYAPSEFLNDPQLWRTLRHPADRARVLAAERAADVTRQPFHAEYRMTARDGRQLWFRDDAVVIERSGSGDTLWQGVMVDITAEKAAEEQARRAELRYRSLVETLPAVVFIDQLDERASNMYTSPQSELLLGYTTQDWDEDRDLWAKILHPEDRDRCLAAQARHVESAELFDQTYRLIARDGRTLWIRDVAVIVHDDDGTPLYSQGFLLDITAQKEAELALQAALEREQESAERLRQMDEMRGRLLHTLSHDLRGPLTAILMSASTLERSGLSEADAAEIVRGMADRARHMDRLLTELLDPELPPTATTP